MKNNVIFVAKVVIVALLAACLLVVASSVYKSGETYKGTYAGIEKYEAVPEGIDYANFGPSYGMSCFNYEKIEEKGKTGFNFSLTMQNLYHDYALYKTYEGNFNDGAVIAIPLSYFSFCSSTTSASGTRYYKLLPKKYIINYTKENYVSTMFVPVYGKGGALVRDLVNDILNSVMKSAVETDTEEATKAQAVDTASSDDVVMLSNDSKVRVLTIENGNLKTQKEHIEANEEILVNWIEEMKAKGLKPILLLTPYWYEYANGFDAELLNECYIEPVSRVINKTGVDYVNFCDDKHEKYNEYIHTPEYFSNCDHVSQEGSKAFMELFIEYLEEKDLF